jgi:hypothetical protein
MAKAARKAQVKKSGPKPVKTSSKKAPRLAGAKAVLKKAAMKKAPKKKAKPKPILKRPAAPARRPKAVPARKKTIPRKKTPANKPPARKTARKKPQPAVKEKITAPQRQLLVVEEKKAPMVVGPSMPPAIVPIIAPIVSAPQAQQAAQPSAPPHIDASSHDDGPLAILLAPALDMLPEWEDRLRLRRAIFEDGLAFYSLGRGCPEYHEASIALSKSGKDAHEDVQGYFIVCLKDRSGKMVGAMDGHMLENGVMAVGRSFVKGDKRREMHILLYSAALSGHQPSYILLSMKKPPLSVDFAARLILLGRGFGFCALPLQKTDMMFFIRRVKRELDPIATGQELAKALSSVKPLMGLEKEIAELESKGVVPLISLPTSPDSREHLHELRDVVLGLGISAPDLETVLEKLRVEYILQRKDLTPVLFF